MSTSNSTSAVKPLSERTKVVVRNLPPTLGVEAFKEVLDKHMPPDTYNWLQYYPGKIRCARGTCHASCQLSSQRGSN